MPFSKVFGSAFMVTVKRGSCHKPLERSAAYFPGPVTTVTGKRLFK